MGSSSLHNFERSYTALDKRSPDDAFFNSDNPRIRAMVDPLLELAARTEAEREHFDALGARDKVAKY